MLQASPRSTPDKFTVDIPNENNRYDDLVDYNGRDILIALPFKTTVYDIMFFAVVDTINGRSFDVDQIITICSSDRVLGKVKIPPPKELEAHPIPPARGKSLQWWPEQTPPTGTPRNYRPSGRGTPTVPGQGIRPTETPIKIYELPNCREFLGRKVR